MSLAIRILIAGVLLAVLFPGPPMARAQDTIVWPYFPFIPFFIVEDHQVGGYGVALQNFFWTRMPEYRHERKHMPGNRMLEGMRAGLPYCFVGLIRTPEREEYIAYSLPCRLLFPSVIGFRAEDQARFGSGPKVSLTAIAADPKLIFGAVKGESNKPQVDRIIRDNFREGENLVYIYEGDESANKLKMLISRRIDFAFFEPYEVPLLAAKYGLKGEIIFRPMEESTDYGVGCVGCPKNEWGYKAIARINEILRAEVDRPEFKDIFRPYVPDGLKSEFETQYRRLIVEPAQR